MSSKKSSQISFEYTPLCDPHVVTWMIDNRSTVQCCMEYGDLNQDIMFSYIDLDRLIDKTKLSANEKLTVSHLMLGYSITDLSEMYGQQRQAFNTYYKRAIEKICKMADQTWGDFYGGRPAKGFCY